MAEGDPMHDIFGSGSEDDADWGEPTGGDEPELEGGPAAEAGTGQDQMRELFGSEDEEDEEDGAAGPSARAAAGEDDEAEEEEREEASTSRPRGPPMLVEAALADVPASDQLRLVRLANLISIEARPFDPETYDMEEEGAPASAPSQHDTTLFWRWAAAPDGTIVRQSNARFVRWSDGSLQLLLGREALDVREIDVRGEHSYVFARHPNVIQGQGTLTKKMAFQPASLSSRFHRRLATAVDRRHARQSKVRATTTMADPAKQKRERELLEEQRIRDKERLAERQARQMRKFVPAPRPSMLSSAYLEEEEEEEEFDDGEGAGIAAMTNDQHARLRSRSSHFDEGAEREGEHRLAQAKTAPAPPPPVPGKRRRTIESESDEEEDMADFIVDDEPEWQGSPSRAEKKARSMHKKRAVLLEDSDGED